MKRTAAQTKGAVPTLQEQQRNCSRKEALHCLQYGTIEKTTHTKSETPQQRKRTEDKSQEQNSGKINMWKMEKGKKTKHCVLLEVDKAKRGIEGEETWKDRETNTRTERERNGDTN